MRNFLMNSWKVIFSHKLLDEFPQEPRNLNVIRDRQFPKTPNIEEDKSH